jgi:hypothetical protein
MKRGIIILSAFVLMSTAAMSQRPAVFVKDNAAIGGYDPVAYFSVRKPIKGDRKFSWRWNNAIWQFANQQNLDSFKVAPEKYAPQYGGYCAYGLADGHKAPTEADAWTIVNGKLYLNYNKDVQGLWSKKRDAYIITADKNWPALKDKE